MKGLLARRLAAHPSPAAPAYLNVASHPIPSRASHTYTLLLTVYTVSLTLTIHPPTPTTFYPDKWTLC